MATFNVEATIHFAQHVTLHVEAESAEAARARVLSTPDALDDLSGADFHTVHADDHSWVEDVVDSVTPIADAEEV